MGRERQCKTIWTWHARARITVGMQPVAVRPPALQFGSTDARTLVQR